MEREEGAGEKGWEVEREREGEVKKCGRVKGGARKGGRERGRESLFLNILDAIQTEFIVQSK